MYTAKARIAPSWATGSDYRAVACSPFENPSNRPKERSCGSARGCALKAHGVQFPEMETAAKPSSQPRTESCVMWRNARWACLVLRIGRSREAPRRHCRPFMSRTFCRARLADGVVKPRLRGEAYMVRYLDDFVLCFQYRADALRVQKALYQRLGKFGLTLESSKTKLVEFGRYAQRHASKRGRKRPETKSQP